MIWKVNEGRKKKTAIRREGKMAKKSGRKKGK